MKEMMFRVDLVHQALVLLLVLSLFSVMKMKDPLE